MRMLLLAALALWASKVSAAAFLCPSLLGNLSPEKLAAAKARLVGEHFPTGALAMQLAHATQSGYPIDFSRTSANLLVPDGYGDLFLVTYYPASGQVHLAILAYFRAEPGVPLTAQSIHYESVSPGPIYPRKAVE